MFQKNLIGCLLLVAGLFTHTQLKAADAPSKIVVVICEKSQSNKTEEGTAKAYYLISGPLRNLDEEKIYTKIKNNENIVLTLSNGKIQQSTLIRKTDLSGSTNVFSNQLTKLQLRQNVKGVAKSLAPGQLAVFLYNANQLSITNMVIGNTNESNLSEAFLDIIKSGKRNFTLNLAYEKKSTITPGFTLENCIFQVKNKRFIKNIN